MTGRENCIFCRIADGAADSHVVFEDDGTIGFLDHRPLVEGHVLVIPKAHHDTLDDVPRDELGPFLRSTQLVARALERGLGVDGTFVGLNVRVSQTVPHVHFHVLPRRHGDGLFGWRALGLLFRRGYSSDGRAEEVREKIAGAVRELG